MTLEKQDAELFYELWFPLLDFVNQNTGYVPTREPLTGAEASMLPMRRRLQIICGPTHRCFRNTLPSQGLRDSLTFVMQNHRGQDI